MGYVNTFIQVADDCPVEGSVVPVAKGDKKTIALIQYELLSENPYHYTQEDLLFEAYARHKGVPDHERDARRAEFFSKSQACLRASPLPKSYGWGLHFNGEGKVALCAAESEAYRRFLEATGDGVKLLKAMRSSRA